MTDQEILALYEARALEATASMQRQYGAYCAGIIERILTDPRDREECLNDVWLRVWNALEHRRPMYLKGWLGAVARNCAITRYQQLGRQAEQIEVQAEELAQSLQDTPAEQMEYRALGEAISAFLETQPTENRIVFVRRYWYGDTVEQAARHQGWTKGKTKTVLFRMREKLRHFLIKEGYLDGEPEHT